MDIQMNLIGVDQAREILEHLLGTPTENRVMVVYNSGEKKTESGLFIPGTVKEDIPRKGVVVAIGPITEENKSYSQIINIGSIITYGLYAGKEVTPLFSGDYGKDLNTDLKFSVLSLNEIIYVEPNN